MQEFFDIVTHPSNRMTLVMWILVIVAVYFFFVRGDGLNYFEGFTGVGNAPLEHAPLTDNEKVDQAICSPKCCAQPYPTGIVLNDARVSGDHVPTGYRCTGEGGPGCVCLSAKQADYVGARGGNGLNLL